MRGRVKVEQKGDKDFSFKRGGGSTGKRVGGTGIPFRLQAAGKN